MKTLLVGLIVGLSLLSAGAVESCITNVQLNVDGNFLFGAVHLFSVHKTDGSPVEHEVGDLQVYHIAANTSYGDTNVCTTGNSYYQIHYTIKNSYCSTSPILIGTITYYIQGVQHTNSVYVPAQTGTGKVVIHNPQTPGPNCPNASVATCDINTVHCNPVDED